MSSVVFICNLALSNIGKPNITDINEASAEAKACKQFYDHVRDLLLQSYPWTFARKTAPLAGITNSKPRRWRRAYQRPNDCLKVRRVSDETFPDYLPYGGDTVAGGFPYEIEGAEIFCNLSPAFLEYTRKVVDPTRYPPLFVDAFGWHLAVRLAMPMTRDPKVRADAYQLAVQMQTEAAVADANEVRETSDYPAEAIEARE